MPIVYVAPIYSDPWVQDHYEGMARLIEAVPDTPDRTINGITCRLYCVRFFYTSVNRRRWVEVSAILEWQDTVDRYVPLRPSTETTAYWKYSTVLRLEAQTPTLPTWGANFIVPALNTDDVILGIGFSYSIDTDMHADSWVRMTFNVHESLTPTDGETALAVLTASDQSNTFILAYLALGAPHIVSAHDSFSIGIHLYAKEVNSLNGWLYLKAPLIRLERSI